MTTTAVAMKRRGRGGRRTRDVGKVWGREPLFLWPAPPSIAWVKELWASLIRCDVPVHRAGLSSPLDPAAWLKAPTEPHQAERASRRRAGTRMCSVMAGVGLSSSYVQVTTACPAAEDAPRWRKDSRTRRRRGVCSWWVRWWRQQHLAGAVCFRQVTCL